MTRLDADQIARMRLMSGGALYDYALRLVDEVVRLRATIEAVSEALAGDGQAVLRVAAAQQVLIDADRQEQP